MIGKEIEQQFGITVGIDVPPRQELRQFLGIGQVSIVRDTNSVGIIRVERLGFGATARASGRIPTVTNPHVATQFLHVMCLKDVLDETIVLSQVQAAAFGSHNASSVLAAVLQHSQAVKEHLIDLTLHRKEVMVER
jgi:hypothetical protein